MQPDLTNLLSFLTNALQQTKDFSLEQAPLFIRELLMWKIYTAAIWAVSLTFVFITIDIFVENMSKIFDDDGTNKAVTYIIRCAAALLIIITIGTNTYTVLQVKVAPRLVVVEMVRNLISNK